MSRATLGRVLVVDDEANITAAIRRTLERAGYAVETAATADDAWSRVEQTGPDVVLCDVRLGDSDGIELLGRIRDSYPDISVIVMTGYASIESAVGAIKAGAIDYLPKPFNPDQIRHVVAKALEQARLREENLFLKAELQQLGHDRIVFGQSRVMRQLFENARTVAGTDSSVLITGKSGTGKEILARFIHGVSARKARPFVTVNCAAIPANLFESELFGHRRGAFTGAVYSRRGSFELASGGTIFLDEIGEMPLDMQVKILRVIEERKITRVGSEGAVDIDVRIMAATNKDLEQETKAGRFREDLYWRINVVHLVVPPLAEHPEDIVPLANHFLAAYAREQKKPVSQFAPEALDAFVRHDWPGNVRELRNAVERAVIFAEAGQPIRSSHLPAYLRQAAPKPAPSGEKTFRTLREVEADHIQEVLDACGGNRRKAAEILGLSVVTLWRKFKKEDEAEPEGLIGS